MRTMWCSHPASSPIYAITSRLEEKLSQLHWLGESPQSAADLMSYECCLQKRERVQLVCGAAAGPARGASTQHASRPDHPASLVLCSACHTNGYMTDLNDDVPNNTTLAHICIMPAQSIHSLVRLSQCVSSQSPKSHHWRTYSLM